MAKTRAAAESRLKSRSDSVPGRSGGTMGLLRKLIIVGGGLALMPSPPDDASLGPDVSQASYIAAAAQTISDASGFCGRSPEACVVAGKLAASLEAKAKYGARLIYEWASHDEPTVMQQVDAMETGSTSSASKQQISSSTLEIDDLIPPWLGPKPAKG
jgi:Family of unknown function (DUF5330)